MVDSPGGSGTFSVCFCGTLATSSLSITGVITMKMMSSTSTTSMSGVTLISAWGPRLPLPTEKAI